MFCGDTFEACRRLPEAFADLIIVDPPYNLSKNYHGNKFGSCSHEEYREFTEKWMDAVLPLLGLNGTVYVCCDWYSGMIISEELEKRLTLRGRITWQREKGRGADSNWKNCMEDVWYATASDKYKFNLDAVKMRRRVLAPYKKDGFPKDWEETKDGKFRDTCPSNFWDDISALEENLKKYPQSTSAEAKAFFAKDCLLSNIERLRQSADAIELLTGKQFMPYPSYEDILYSVKY
jgi:site-specific DNA-methyltransferase (adenine-specific)